MLCYFQLPSQVQPYRAFPGRSLKDGPPKRQQAPRSPSRQAAREREATAVVPHLPDDSFAWHQRNREQHYYWANARWGRCMHSFTGENFGPSALPQSPPLHVASFSLLQWGWTLKKSGLCIGDGGIWGWQLTLGSSKLSSHGQNSEHTVLSEQLKLTLRIRQHVQLNYIM